MRALFGVGSALSLLLAGAAACDGDDVGAAPTDTLDAAVDAQSSDGGGSDGAGQDGAIAPPPSRWSVLGDRFGAFAVSPDAIYVVSWNAFSNNVRWTIEKRSLVDGALVPSFGQGGVVEEPLDPAALMSGGVRIAADADGITLVGHFGEVSKDRLERRRASDGSLVWAKTVSLCSNAPERHLLASDDTFVYDGCFGVLEKRLKASGEPDPAFQDGGPFLRPSPNNGGLSVSRLSAFVVEGDALVAYGQRAVVGPEDFTRFQEARSTTTGVTTWENALAKPATSGGDIGGGSAFFVSTSAGRWRLEKRSLATGELDGAFGTAGVLSGAAEEDGLYPSVVAVTGLVYVATTYTAPGTFERSLAVRAFESTTGAAVAAFGQGGRLLVGLATKDPNATSGGIAVDDSSLYTFAPVYLADGGRVVRIERRDRATGAL